MDKSFRINEYKILAYRLLLAYFFYFIARILFYIYNQDLVAIDSIGSFLKLCVLGLTFDTTAILYTNLLFILLSVLPLIINTLPKFQKLLFWVYFFPNLIAFATNFIDFAYYRFTFARASVASLESINNEPNKSGLLFSFVGDYWHIFLLFGICTFLWIKLYKRVQIVKQQDYNSARYFSFSIFAFLLIGVLIIGGIRGDFKHSTRPITLIDASRHVEMPEHANIVLNTPFSIIRTFGNNNFEKKSGISEAIIQKAFHPIKEYPREVSQKPNIVLIILESVSREYVGSFNKEMGIENYVGYTPFIDSLAQHSLIFTNAYTNGRKSIHAMSSILAGIPSFKTAYTSSPYATQKTQSLISNLNEMGYDTSFFHGAPNGSMGFSGYANILGFDHYYGKTEYNNDADYDGIWGIWDEPFLGYVNEELSKKQEPFMGTVFTVTSHTPYIIPEKYEGKFPEGHVAMHKCIGYTDHALKTFFEAAAKESWYENTIFVITADHTNQIYYDEYLKMVNRFAVPILFYSPKGDLLGSNNDLAMQIDIFPTLMDLTGYNKPFRSWGRSLVSDSIQKPYAITHNGSNMMFMRDSLIGVFTNDNTLGFYDISDKGLTNNLKSEPTENMQQIEQMARGFEQDYMNRIIDGHLSAEESTGSQ
ncbi:sulfatase-like hydrolase/transferase [Aurantibacter crassamenti]|uniref:LTA synthase family protein n=1 Tax=Aurantibacter crassamenti TaxID=1837375 RepID=UPI0019397895|nr:alkaline phosphatase family protein [Aurantibacter crassamenti]MBM1107306.1 sulfatase-like hydrolase/transferase [Aurantibacter crassamenti]